MQGNVTDGYCFVYVFSLVLQHSLCIFASLAIPCHCCQVNSFLIFSLCAAVQLVCCCITCGNAMLPPPDWFFIPLLCLCAVCTFLPSFVQLACCCIMCSNTTLQQPGWCCFMFSPLCHCIACKQWKLLPPGWLLMQHHHCHCHCHCHCQFNLFFPCPASQFVCFNIFFHCAIVQLVCCCIVCCNALLLQPG